jgi:hypothetical protein
VTGNSLELFAFIEVDDRRGSKTCHLYLCEPGSGKISSARLICDSMARAFAASHEEVKKRAGWGVFLFFF